MLKKAKKILVVDDDPDHQKRTKELLLKGRFKVIPCLIAKECLDMAKREQPDAILMDVILADGDGKELARQLMRDPQTAGIPIIFATNTVGLQEDKGDESFEIDGKLCRAFAKPFHKDKILSVLKKEIARSQSGGELPQTVLQKAEKNTQQKKKGSSTHEYRNTDHIH